MSVLLEATGIYLIPSPCWLRTPSDYMSPSEDLARVKKT